MLRKQQDRLVTHLWLGEIDDRKLTDKATELRDREGNLMLQRGARDVGRPENNGNAIKASELLQSLRPKWLTADYAAILRGGEFVFLNFVFDEETLAPATERPFDAFAEGLDVSSNRGDRTAIELFLAGLSDWAARSMRLLTEG